MAEHADRIAEIEQMLDADDPGTTRGDLQSACWALLDEIERLQGLVALAPEASRLSGKIADAALIERDASERARDRWRRRAEWAEAEVERLQAERDAMSTEWGVRDPHYPQERYVRPCRSGEEARELAAEEHEFPVDVVRREHTAWRKAEVPTDGS